MLTEEQYLRMKFNNERLEKLIFRNSDRQKIIDAQVKAVKKIIVTQNRQMKKFEEFIAENRLQIEYDRIKNLNQKLKEKQKGATPEAAKSIEKMIVSNQAELEELKQKIEEQE